MLVGWPCSHTLEDGRKEGVDHATLGKSLSASTMAFASEACALSQQQQPR